MWDGIIRILIMGMDEVYDLLKKWRGCWMSSRQIAEKLGLSYSTVSTNLAGLRKRGMVKRKEMDGKFRRYVYQIN